jgi:O-antigen ligase
MLFAAPGACRDYEGCMKMLRAIMVASVVWTVCSSVQFVINPRFLVNTQGRFWGMLANAQQAAMLCAPFAVIALWLLLNDKTRRLRLLWLGLIGINLLFVAWTASRTGVLMLVLGAAFVLYNRLGKLVLLLPVGGVLVFGLSFLADELQITSNIERLTSTENTRAGVWSAQLANIMESPLIGVGWHETGGSESSWLGGFAGYGLGMFLLMIAFLAWSMWRCATLWVRRRRLPREYRPMIDMYISWNAMYFGAATFEGIILGRSSTSQMLLLMMAGIGVWLVEQTQLAAEHPVEDDESYEPGLIDEHLADDYGFDDGHAYPARRQPA